MQSKPRFHKQEKLFSCLPACLKMVLSGLGLEISEAELRERCDCTPFGTEALKAVDAARDLGFPQTVKCNLVWDELTAQLNRGLYPIVFVNLLPIAGVKDAHAIVVLEVNATHVSVLDPLQVERALPISTFSSAWAMMNNLAILVCP
jgi:ABC-type bacteriocin/lantibiotic exporter with double-glycine peptidase domain